MKPFSRDDRLCRVSLLCAVAGLLLCAAAGHAAPVAYEPFLAGGASPDTAAGEYMTGTGYTSDSLVGQAPTVSGFVSDPWASPSSYASYVYYRTEDGQLGYSDDNAWTLATAPGQLNLFRSSSSSSANKDISRILDIGTSLPENLYMSMLVQLSGDDVSFMLRSASAGYNMRRFEAGIDSDGHPFVTGSFTDSGGTTYYTDTNTAVTVSPDEAHLLVVKLTNDGSTSDQIDLFLDPYLESESLNSPVATIDNGNFYVAGNPTWTLEDIFFRNVIPSATASIVMDEVRIGAQWADVTPMVPEPSTFLLSAIGLAGVGLAGRRRRRLTSSRCSPRSPAAPAGADGPPAAIPSPCAPGAS